LQRLERCSDEEKELKSMHTVVDEEAQLGIPDHPLVQLWGSGEEIRGACV
jgi:hypothetical protein